MNTIITFVSQCSKVSFVCFILVIFASNTYADLDFKGESPWSQIRKQRLQEILPSAMLSAKVDAWLIICRENNNDPMAKHVGCENAGKTAAFVFYFANRTANGNEIAKLKSLAFSPIGEAKALRDLELLDVVYDVPRDQSAISHASEFIKQNDFRTVAINFSELDPQADGISFTQHYALSKALGDSYSKRLVSANTLIHEYLSIKLPAEVLIMQAAAVLTAKWQIEAYQQIVVGKTTDADVARFLKQKMMEYGVTDAWAPSQNPNVVSGSDRGHSHATNRVIQGGDVIQTDFGIRVFDTWVTDIQRFAYVLKENESAPPSDVAYYWESAKAGREAAFKAMKPGVTGKDVDNAQRKVMQATNSKPVMWNTGHPVGYVAHDSGPSLSAKNPAGAKILKPGMTFSFDGFHSWTMDNGQSKTISVEEMVVITNDGAEYLIPPQQKLVLIK
jgi:Xaa-Pro dipeptidase